MSKLYRYQKITDQYTTYTLRTADNDNERAVELGTIDGETYVLVPDSMVLPSQPEQISDSVVYIGDSYDEKRLISNFNLTRKQPPENRIVLIATELNKSLCNYIYGHYDAGTQQTFQAMIVMGVVSAKLQTSIKAVFPWIQSCLEYYYTKKNEIIVSGEPTLVTWDFVQFDVTKPDITLEQAMSGVI